MTAKPDESQLEGLARQVETLHEQVRELYATLDHLRSSGELIMPPHRKWP